MLGIEVVELRELFIEMSGITVPLSHYHQHKGYFQRRLTLANQMIYCQSFKASPGACLWREVRRVGVIAP